MTGAGGRVPYLSIVYTRVTGVYVCTDAPASSRLRDVLDLLVIMVTCRKDGDSTEHLEDTDQDEAYTHTHTHDEQPPPPQYRVSHAPHVATWTAPA